MKKTTNMIIKDAKTTLVGCVNDMLEQGVPITVVQLILQVVMDSVTYNTDAILKLESEQMLDAESKQNSQMLWEENTKDNKESED